MEDTYEDYVFRVDAAQQGIAVKVGPPNPRRSNNYISFWNGDNEATGRIEASDGLVSISTNAIWDLVGLPDFDDIIGGSRTKTKIENQILFT